MNAKAVRTRPSRSARSFGYTIAVIVNVTLLYLVNVRPGWQAVPFLTEDTRQVLVLFNVSLVAGIVTNLAFVLYDAPRWKALWDLVAISISLAVLVKVWVVFPFAFDAQEWTIVARTVVMVAMVGTVIAMLVQAFSMTGGTTRSISGRTS
jgi:membrane-associated HD superfamily phosphohydrolase